MLNQAGNYSAVPKKMKSFIPLPLKAVGQDRGLSTVLQILSATFSSRPGKWCGERRWTASAWCCLTAALGSSWCSHSKGNGGECVLSHITIKNKQTNKPTKQKNLRGREGKEKEAGKQAKGKKTTNRKPMPKPSVPRSKQVWSMHLFSEAPYFRKS